MFQQLNLLPKIQKAVDELGFEKPTDVQQQAIPAALEKNDLLVCARTGSGKTAAFVLPLLQHLMTKPAPNSGTRALILVPTRELAKQTLKQCENFAKFTGIGAGMISGGQEFKFQQALFRKNPEIIVATPGRLVDHLTKSKQLLQDVEVLVLDEADRMLDMGFEEDMMAIANACQLKRNPITWLFSATLQGQRIGGVSKQLLNEPVSITVDNFRSEHDNISQHYMLADDDKHKERLLTWLLSKQEYRQAIIFCNTIARTQSLTHFLAYHNIEAACIHGDMSQDERNHVMNRVKQGHVNVLVATDVAARGLDVKAIDLVVNFEMARSGDDYVHRIGRTGRADQSGMAVSLIDATEWNLKATIERYLRVEMALIYEKSLAGKYKGPKKVKSNGKSFGSKTKKNKAAGAKGKDKKAAAKPKKPKVQKPKTKREDGASDNRGGSRIKRDSVWGDGTAPFKPKKKTSE